MTSNFWFEVVFGAILLLAGFWIIFDQMSRTDLKLGDRIGWGLVVFLAMGVGFILLYQALTSL